MQLIDFKHPARCIVQQMLGQLDRLMRFRQIVGAIAQTFHKRPGLRFGCAFEAFDAELCGMQLNLRKQGAGNVETGQFGVEIRCQQARLIQVDGGDADQPALLNRQQQRTVRQQR